LNEAYLVSLSFEFVIAVVSDGVAALLLQMKVNRVPTFVHVPAKGERQEADTMQIERLVDVVASANGTMDRDYQKLFGQTSEQKLD